MVLLCNSLSNYHFCLLIERKCLNFVSLKIGIKENKIPEDNALSNKFIQNLSNKDKNITFSLSWMELVRLIN